MNTDKGSYTTVPIDVAIKINGVQLQLDPQRLLNSSEMSPSQLHFKFPTTENSNLYLHFSSNSLFHHLTLSQHKTLFPTLLTERMRGRNFSSCLSSHFHRDLISYPYFSSLSPIQSSPLSNCLHPLQHIDYSLPSSHHRQISVSIFLLPVHSYLLQSGFWFHQFTEIALLMTIFFRLLYSTCPLLVAIFLFSWFPGHCSPLVFLLSF